MQREASDLERTTQERIGVATHEAEKARREAQQALAVVLEKEKLIGDAKSTASALVDAAMREADRVRLDAEKVLEDANSRARDAQAAVGRLRDKMRQSA